MSTPLPSAWVLLILLSLILSLAGKAQNALLVEHKGNGQIVRDASKGRALIEIEGRLVIADGTRFILKKVAEFAPAFVSVHDFRAGTGTTEIVGAGVGSDLNRTINFRARFQSPYHLKRVFMVVETNLEEANKRLFLWEIGELLPNALKTVDISLDAHQRQSMGKYKVHLFSDGLEVFHSMMRSADVEAALDTMVARRVKGAPDGGPSPFVGPAPDYPAALLKAGTVGDAVVSIRITPNGRVIEPTIKTATLPDFGESALVAIRQWRFIPKVENGQPVESSIDLPLHFAPPTKDKAESN